MLERPFPSAGLKEPALGTSAYRQGWQSAKRQPRASWYPRAFVQTSPRLLPPDSPFHMITSAWCLSCPEPGFLLLAKKFELSGHPPTELLGPQLNQPGRHAEGSFRILGPSCPTRCQGSLRSWILIPSLSSQACEGCGSTTPPGSRIYQAYPVSWTGASKFPEPLLSAE